MRLKDLIDKNDPESLDFAHHIANETIKAVLPKEVGKKGEMIVGGISTKEIVALHNNQDGFNECRKQIKSNAKQWLGKETK